MAGRVLLCIYRWSCSLVRDTKNNIRAFFVYYLCLFVREVIDDWFRFSSPEVIFYRARIISCSRCILGDRRRRNLEHRRREGESVLRKACDTRASTSGQTISSSSPYSVCAFQFIISILLQLYSCAILIYQLQLSVLVSMNIFITSYFI